MTQAHSIPGPDNITRVQLDNGIIVLAYENPHVQSVAISGILSNGSIYESAHQSGLASLTANALMLGTESRDFDTLHEELEGMGADLGLDASRHAVSFSGKALAEDLPHLMGVFSDVLRHPAFPEDQVERMRGQHLTSLNYNQQDSGYRAGRAFAEALYPADHAYHHPTQGRILTVADIQIDDMRAFHARCYGPRGMVVVIVGNVRPDAAVAIVQDYLGDWTNPEQPDPVMLEPLSAPQTVHRINTTLPGKSQSDVVLGTLGPSRFADDYMAATLANSILGEFGMMGRLGEVIRKKGGMAYYAYSRIAGGSGPGAWSIRAGVAPDRVDEAIQMMASELRRLTTEPVSKEDLADNQSYFTGRLPLRLQSSEGIAGTLVAMERYGLGMDYLLNYHDMIYGLTQDDLLAAVQHYLKPDAYVVSVAGPNGAQ